MEMNIGMRGGKRFGRWLWIGVTCLPTVAIPGIVTLPGTTQALLRADEPLGVAASYGAGVHAYYDGNYQTAYDALTAAIEAGTLDPRAYYFRGLTALKLGRLDEATHRAALSHPDAAIRRNATRALGTDARAVALYFSSSVVSDPDPLTRLAALVKLAEFSETKQIQSVVASLVRNPANQSDEWLREATRILGRIHGAALYRNGENLIAGSGFETFSAAGLPTGWQRRDTGTREGNKTATWTAANGEKEFHGGRQSVRLAAPADCDTTLNTEVAVKPNTPYRLAGWVKTKNLSGRITLSEVSSKTETEIVRRRDSDWAEIETDFNSGDRTQAAIRLVFSGRGEVLFDDVRLTELIALDDPNKLSVADAIRGGQLFHQHPAACVLCHAVKGQGSNVGPALDGLASRSTPASIRESLLEPSKVIAKGYEQYTISPMPPMGIIFSPQEISDLEAYLQTLK
jgi:mono/diheme cytochrome c family protein